MGGISYERRHSYMHLVSNFLQVMVSFKSPLQALSLRCFWAEVRPSCLSQLDLLKDVLDSQTSISSCSSSRK